MWVTSDLVRHAYHVSVMVTLQVVTLRLANAMTVFMTLQVQRILSLTIYCTLGQSRFYMYM